MTRLAPVSVVLLLLATAACGGEEPPSDGAAARDTVLQRDPAREPADTAGRPGPGSDTAVPPPTGDASPVGVDEWTVGIVRGGPPLEARADQPTVTAVRTARHPEYDRFVLEFTEAGGLPPFNVEYVDRPVRECGSGHVVELPGDGWLRIRMDGARAHDDEGRATVETREGSPGFPVLLAHDLTCDFEGQVEWVLAVASPNRYRVLDLREPYRLVVDVRHR